MFEKIPDDIPRNSIRMMRRIHNTKTIPRIIKCARAKFRSSLVESKAHINSKIRFTSGMASNMIVMTQLPTDICGAICMDETRCSFTCSTVSKTYTPNLVN